MGRKGDGVLKYGRVVWRNKSKDLDIKVAEEMAPVQYLGWPLCLLQPTNTQALKDLDAGGRNWMSDFPGQIGWDVK